MSTRLDRLFVLLDTGSTPLIRRSAAEQLGDVIHLHPHELSNLLNKVHGFLKSTNWETRVAASHAVECISKRVPQWEPKGAYKLEDGEVSQPVVNGMMMFSHFNINHVLSSGASLLASEGNQFDSGQGSLGMEDKEQLLQQRQLLNKRLGLDNVGSLGLDSSSLFNDNDLKIHVTSTNNNLKSVEEIIARQLPKSEFQLSTRERNVAKRKARSLSKQFSSSPISEGGTPLKCVKVERSDGSLDSMDSSFNGEEEEDWPFQSFCDVLMNDLFHPCWEVRHGAASGLREVIKHHGTGAGKSADMLCSQQKLMNQVWLSDISLRLLCVLALDRFGDFVSDEVVAPVRETCAQALGSVLKHMDEDAVTAVVKVSLHMLTCEEWEVRHGALLSLKYSLAVRQDMTSYLLPIALPAALRGLKDPDDDVRAVAASALLPVADAVVGCMPVQIPAILLCLWDTLCDLDDLTASTNSIMTLLAKLTALSVTDDNSEESPATEMSLTNWAPRLWPFLRHNIVSVRKAALETFQTLLKMHDVQTTRQWLVPIYQDAVRHIYQRSILENRPELHLLIVSTWELLLERGAEGYLTVVAVPWLGVWLAFLMQPAHMSFDSSLLIETKHKPRDLTTQKAKAQAEARHVATESKYYIGGLEATLNNSLSESDTTIHKSRLCGSKLFALLVDKLCHSPAPPQPTEMESPIVTLGKLFSFHLSGKSALQRFIVGYVIYFWAQLSKPCPCPENVRKQLLFCLEEPILYDEMAFAFTRLQTDCRDFLSSLKLQGIDLESAYPPGQLLSVESALELTSQLYPQHHSRLKPPLQAKFDDRARQLQASTTQTGQDQQQHHVRVMCSLAMAVVALDALPDKLNPVVRPLMDVIKKGENAALQEEAASCLAQLIRMCKSRTPNPNAKVIKNLCNFLCSDATVTPCVTNLETTGSQGSDQTVSCGPYEGILTLTKLQKVTEKPVRRRQRSSVANASRRDSKGEAMSTSSQGLMDIVDSGDITKEQAEMAEAQRQLSVQRKGAEIALAVVARTFHKDLPTILPILWDVCVNGISAPHCSSEEPSSDISMDASQIQELINSLQTIEILIPALHPELRPTLLKHLDHIRTLLSNKWAAVRHMSGRVLGSLCLSIKTQVMHYVVESVLPLLDVMADERMREGSTEAVANIVERLGMDCLPYLVVLMIPILGRMSDQNTAVRMIATHCFANLIQLLPLEAGVADPPDMEKWLVERKVKERRFLDQLLDTKKLDDYIITVPIKSELREYQQDGVKWLGFLNKYKLHGILCDDMGLGKTLQSICILATDHFERETKYKSSKSPELKPLPSIVVCPPTLVGHWVYEINKFVDPVYLNPLMYAGPPPERDRLQKLVKNHNLIVASYEVVRNDLDFFSKIKWNYCILDEGHIIRNGKTKLAKAVKSLVSNYRLILSGTPIQNNVLDLWSLFDFLMPGFLGNERQFLARFGRPIIQSRGAKTTSKEQEAGSLAMESLHRQVLPFILRRLKEDVLKDLPPKIIQDYFSDLSPLQVELYEDFAKSRAREGVDETVSGEDNAKDTRGTTHIFQALQYLRKLCNHPALVLNKSHPRYAEITARLATNNSSLKDLSHAPKLTALRQLLNDSGIGLTPNLGGGSSNGQGGLDTTPVVNQHRVLLFCQLKSMLDIVEHDLLKTHMPSVSFLRLDGTVPAGNRHDIVHRFNSDPSIDILLLSTHVGGLGLNLTGADTVIFVEHDWNPMKDLQAMDRAHRIGQKKVVNVYRLITRGTLEEKIMNLQKFKMAVANTIISQDNSSLNTMGTEQLLDLFVLDQAKGSAPDDPSKGKKGDSADDKKGNVKSILQGLEELWDESQYENEYDMEKFMESLGSVKRKKHK